jgi:hypothetical protein
MDEAGVTPDQVDGVICCDSHIVRRQRRLRVAVGGLGRTFARRTDSEWGLTLVNAQWLIAQMGLPNVKFAPTGRADHQRNGGHGSTGRG